MRISINQHIQAIAEILYQEANSESIKRLEGIEETIRDKTDSSGLNMVKK